MAAAALAASDKTGIPVVARGQVAFRGIVLLGLVVALAAITWVLPQAGRVREQAAIEAAEHRLAALAGARAEVLEAWIQAQERSAARIRESELVRLFASEWLAGGRDGLLRDALREQLPYMWTLLEDFARAQGLVGAGLIGPDGEWLAGDGGSGPGQRLRADLVEQALARAQVVRGIVPGRPTRLITALPIQALDETGTRGRSAVAALVLTAPLQEQLSRLLARRPLDADGEMAAVLTRDSRNGALLFGQDAAWMPAPSGWTKDAGGVVKGPDDASVILRLVPVAGSGLEIAQWIDLAAVLAPSWATQRIAWSLSLLAIALLGLVALVVIRHLSARQQAALARQYRELAARIESQRQLLDGITASVPAMIGLIDRAGRLSYANQPLALAAGRGLDGLRGRKLGEVLDRGAAAVIGRLVERTRATGRAATATERLRLGGNERSIDLRLMPFLGDGQDGILLVASDVTELLEARELRLRRVRQTVDAFVRAVELADPWLEGHTRRLRETAMAIGMRQGLSPEELATIDIAASLSQVGKLFIPRELLTKAGRHSPEESRLMRVHIQHAMRILAGVELDLPAAQTIAQMHERLDGSGYPAGLAGEAVSPAARALAVADVFCARTSPRSYRDAARPELVLAVLRGHPERYDAAAVAALAAQLQEALDATTA